MLKKTFKHLNNKKGFTFAECVVAIAIFAVIGTLAFSMFDKSIRYMNKAHKVETARSEAEAQFAADDFRTAEGEFEIIYPDDFVVMMVINGKEYYGVKRYYTISTGEIETVVVSVTFVKVYAKGVEESTNKRYTDNLFVTSDNRNLIVRLYPSD